MFHIQSLLDIFSDILKTSKYRWIPIFSLRNPKCGSFANPVNVVPASFWSKYSLMLFGLKLSYFFSHNYSAIYFLFACWMKENRSLHLVGVVGIIPFCYGHYWNVHFTLPLFSISSVFISIIHFAVDFNMWLVLFVRIGTLLLFLVSNIFLLFRKKLNK